MPVTGMDWCKLSPFSSGVFSVVSLILNQVFPKCYCLAASQLRDPSYKDFFIHLSYSTKKLCCLTFFFYLLGCRIVVDNIFFYLEVIDDESLPVRGIFSHIET